uniref:Protein GOLM2 n=1 Tax=Geotrypetes seraphini TaxID=260995 RepID=A0A6P8NI33_GEOSA|nr:protein CASC4 isoform X2 [Geotrypetes seraphini]
MVGFGANRRTGRLPPFVLGTLLLVIALLAFNYWSVSCRLAALHEELLGLQAQVTRTEVARSRLEKRNSELAIQVDAQLKKMVHVQGDYKSLSSQSFRCETEKIKLQNNVSHQIAGLQRLKEQLAELHQEFLRQENQLLVQKSNNTFLLQRLTSESTQCAQQMKDLEIQYEANLKNLEQAAQVIPSHSQDIQNVEPIKENDMDVAGDQMQSKHVQQIAEKSEMRVQDPPSNRSQHEREAVKPGDDAGMPEIEEKIPAEIESVLIEPNVNTIVNIEADKENPKKPNLGQSLQMQNKAQFGNSLQQQNPRERDGDFPKLKQSRFFDENESPVDPHHGSKLADYNGDDGNVGEYEADKQAELAYNEEEDGDGGEEDVQDDEERELQGDPVDYQKERSNDAL